MTPIKVEWTADLDEELRRLAATGASPAAIGKALGISSLAASTRMSRIRVRPLLTWNQRDRIAELHRKGWRVSRISRQVGLDEDVVVQQIEIAASGLDLKSDTKWTPEDDALIRELVDEGATSRQIAAMLYRSPSAIENRRAEIGAVSPWSRAGRRSAA